MRNRPLRLAVDATSLLGQPTGVGQVTSGLIGAMAARPEFHVIAYAVTWRGRNELSPRLPHAVRPGTAAIPARLTRALWMRFDVPRIERWTGSVDVVHGTAFVGPPARAPVVVTVHDLTCVRFPELCTRDTLRYPRLIQRALARGATVHAVSEFVADEIRAHFDVSPERVSTIYAGLAPIPDGNPVRGRRLAGTERYVLALATIEPRKNLPALVRAFDVLAARVRDLRLVVAGPDGWGRDAFEAACEAARYRDRIVRLGYVSGADRSDLLTGATVYAYPSLYEGFGHPPLEAMAARVPVVAARAGAVPEVLGDAALLVDPDDIDGLADALERAAGDVELRECLASRGIERAGRFTWERAAGEFAALYRRIASAG